MSMGMSRSYLRLFVKEQGEAKHFNDKAIDHVTDGLMNLCRWYESHQAPLKPISLGGFLTAVIENNFIEAITRADDTNLKALPIYARFIYASMPPDYRKILAGATRHVPR